MWKGMGFQNLVGFTFSQLESLHDLVMVWLFIILSVVSWISVMILISSKGELNMDSELLEKGWTIVPMIILLTIALPSLHLLCLQDAMCQDPSASLKVISNQWNWQSEIMSEEIDHLLDPEEVDNLASYENPMTLLSNGMVRVIVISTDVLHSLGFPSLGVKLDSMPGRLNVTTMETTLGMFAGSCYELCGSGHSAMPINLLVL